MFEIEWMVVSKICDAIYESLNDKTKTKAEMREMEEQLKNVFSNYENEYELDRISSHLQDLVPQIVAYCQMPNGVSLSKKAEELVDLLEVPTGKKGAAVSMVEKVLGIVNNAVNSVRSHDARAIENRQEQRHCELTDDHSDIKTGINDIKREMKTISEMTVKLPHFENLRARIRDISEDQIEVVIEAVRDAVPGAIFAFACANDFKDFGLVLTGEYSCGHDVLHFSNDEEYSLNARTLMPQHIQVGPGFPCEFIVKHTAPLRDYCVFIMTSQRPPEYDMIPIV